MMSETLQMNAGQNQVVFTLSLGEMKITNSPSAVLSCVGIGSCVVVCAYDHLGKLGGMVHIVLPHYNQKPEDNLGKYADTAIPLLLDEMAKKGGKRSQLVIKIAGGAQMSLAPGLKDIFKTGERNIEAVKQALKIEGIPLVSADLGGNRGRTVRMYLANGKVTVKISGDEEREI
jgi:chemotaxis protein CheD